MKTIAVINLKGGCGKTTTVIAMADLLDRKYNKRILIIDNDKQGNAAKAMRCYDADAPAYTGEMLLSADAAGNIIHTYRENIDIIPCNLKMELAETGIKKEQGAQHDRYRRALEKVREEYDYCIIDNPPSIGISVINAIVAADDIIIPVQQDEWSISGLTELTEQIQNIRTLNPDARIAGCLITDYEKSDTSEAAEQWLRTRSGQPFFKQKIRHTRKVKDSTHYRQAVTEYSRRSAAAQDYRKFMMEYMGE